MKKSSKKHPKKEVKMKKKPIKNQGGKKMSVLISRLGAEPLPQVPGDIQINKINNKLIKEKQQQKNFRGG